jgi:hypothetical protein
LEDHDQGLQLISVHEAGVAGAFGELSLFRQEFYQCLTARADALFGLTDAVLCADGSLVQLSLVGEHRRGHGSLYAALARGRVDIERLRTALTAVPTGLDPPLGDRVHPRHPYTGQHDLAGRLRSSAVLADQPGDNPSTVDPGGHVDHPAGVVQRRVKRAALMARTPLAANTSR